MVFIRDGEILQDNDPRLQAPSPQRQAPSQHPDAGSSSSSSGRRPVFDFSASPVRVAPEPQGQSLFGLPGLDIFGAHFQSRHLAILLGATVIFGLRGFLAGTGLWVIYKLSTGNSGGTSPSQQGQGDQAQGSDIAQRIQNLFSNPSANRAYNPGSSPWNQPPRHPAGAGPPAAAPGNSQGWEARGMGQKLGST